MKRQWIVPVIAAICVLFVAAFTAGRGLWLPQVTALVQKTANESINGTVSFAGLDVSLTGHVIVREPVVKDRQGHITAEAQSVDITLNPLQLLRRSQTAAIVDTADINGAVVHLWQNDRTQAWNIESLVKPNRDQTDSGFRGTVNVHDGTVRVQLPDYSVFIGTKIEGAVSFSDYPGLAADATFLADDQKISLSGHYRSKRQFDLTVNGEALELKRLMPFMPATIAVKITAGRAERIRLRAVQSHNGLSLSGQADLKDGAAQAYGCELSELSGRLQLDGRDVILKQLTGAVNGQSVTVGGVIKTDTGAPVFNLDITAPQLSADAFRSFLADLPLSGTAGFTGTVWGTVDNLRLEGNVTLHDASYDGLLIEHAGAVVRYDGQRGSLDDLHAAVAGGTVSGSGTYDKETGAVAVTAHADSVDLSRIPQLPVSLLGVVSGDVTLAGNLNDLPGLTARGSLSAGALSYDGIEVDSAAGDVFYQDGVITLQNGTAAVGDGVIHADGAYHLANGDGAASFTAEKVPLAIFASYLGTPLSGTVSAAGHISGSEPRWDVVFTASSGEAAGMPFDRLEGSLLGTGTAVTIPQVAWYYQDGSHQASGTADLGSRRLDLTVQTKHMRLERLLPAIGKADLPLTGWLDNTLTVSGTVDDPQVAGAVELTDGSAAGFLYQQVRADYRYANGVLLVQNGMISAYDAVLNVAGSIGDALDIRISGNNLDVSRLMPQEGPKRSGILAVEGHIGGTPAAPVGSGTIRADRLVINDIPITDVSGDIGYFGGILRLTNFHFKQNNGVYEANLSHNPATGWIMARASVTGGELADLIGLTTLPLTKVSGKLDGKIALDGTVDAPQVKVTGTISGGVMDGYAVAPADINVTYADDTLQINALTLSVSGGGLLAARGTYAMHGPVSMQIAGKNFPSRILLDVLGKDTVPVDTTLDFAVVLSGTGDAPDADISALLQGGTINGISFTEAAGLMNVKNGVIDLHQAYIARDPYRVSASGKIPLAAIKGDGADQSVDLNIKLDHAGLDALTFLTPLVETADGPMEGQLHLTGNLLAPQINGAVTVKNGSVKIKGVADPLENISADILFNGTTATVSSHGTMDKSGKADKGFYDLKGQVGWDGPVLTKYEGTLLFNQLQLDSDYYKGPLNGELSITAGEALPKLSGTVTVENTKLDIPLNFASGNSAVDMELDLSVTAGKNVRFYHSGLYDLLVDGSVHFGGTLSNPVPSGHFDVQRGNIHCLDTDFRLTKGRAEFTQEGTLLPYINVEAFSRVSHYRIFLTLRGMADAMDLILRSDPPLTKQQIISLITLHNGNGHNSSLDKEDLSGLLGTGLRMTLNSLGITEGLKNALKLDMLTVTTGSLDLNEKNAKVGENYYNIEMGKYLFNDFMITAAFGLNHNDNRVGLQYDLGSMFSINAWKSEDNAFIGGMYRYTF